jgi:hypothetical protein
MSSVENPGNGTHAGWHPRTSKDSVLSEFCLVSRELQSVCLQHEKRSRPIVQALSPYSICLTLHSISCLFLDLGSSGWLVTLGGLTHRVDCSSSMSKVFSAAHVLKLVVWTTLRRRLISPGFVGLRGDLTLGVDRYNSRPDDHTIRLAAAECGSPRGSLLDLFRS